MIQNFSHINQIPQCNDLIDIAFSKTNRKTPTVIRSKFEIHRIRSFYVRKVKFSSGEFIARLDGIVKEFPVLEDVHPFYADLIGILYDRDHYKIALGQVNSTKHRIETIAKEHTRLLNFADSLYRCKELKKAALGRMATTVKKLGESFKYLEEVRQHLSRLPSIDPSARTVVICGFPNVGKSSFMNRVTKAHVDVQPYAFTTKSIFVGHFDYKSLRWQMLDTPGILDQPLADRSSVEMLTIAALAHLKSTVLFFMDLSETCGHTVSEQIALYENLAPLLNLQILVVLSKSDLARLADCADEAVRGFLVGKNYVEMSVAGDVNVDLVRDTACDALLAERVADKQDRACGFAHRIKPVVPFQVNEKYQGAHLGTNPVYGLHENESYFCDDKYDIIPEFYNGKNVSDFIDPSIARKVQELEESARGEPSRAYDILSRDERAMVEACNNARVEATMKAHFAKRATMPQSWKNKVDSSGAIIADKKTASAIVRTERPGHNKKARQETKKTYFDMKPRHTFRPKGSKFAN